MRDTFYTILIVWIVWRILNSISAYRASRNTGSNTSGGAKKSSDGETIIEYVPPSKNKFDDKDGEYVDYEEVK